MINEFFNELVELADVEAVVLFDNEGKIIGSGNNPNYSATTFSELGEAFLHIFGVKEYLDYDIDELAVPFDKGIFYVRNHSKFFLVVIAKPDIELSLIRMMVNVCIKEFLDSRKVKKSLKKMWREKFYQIKSVA
ncbi:MAG: hypothetical protein GWN01_06860, partial [Nitrosopumilaceae archaeon]|nr:hypothetical protein [Nitrosopumilaceae archaeon]NIX61256.1 hypothetical protein [Nitrosopumilaceae archaeon]